MLVQGATGVAGRLAVKVARLLGAGRIVATGRDDEQLREVRALGADTVVNTAVSDEALAKAYLDAKGDGYDVVVDYLWGRPTEILLRSLVPASFTFGKPTRLIQIGESASAALVVAAESLRSSGVEIYGAAKGLSPETMNEVYGQIVSWTRSGELTFDVVKVPLSDIESARQRSDLGGQQARRDAMTGEPDRDGQCATGRRSHYISYMASRPSSGYARCSAPQVGKSYGRCNRVHE